MKLTWKHVAVAIAALTGGTVAGITVTLPPTTIGGVVINNSATSPSNPPGPQPGVFDMWPSPQFSVNGRALMKAWKGFTSLRIKTNTSTTQPTFNPDGGAFRISCNTSHMGFYDPIVYPAALNKPRKSHLHVFFGNSDLDFDTDFSAGLNTFGRSSCVGGIANRSAYWVPAMIDVTTNLPVKPKGNLVYYKNESDWRRANLTAVTWPPANLRIIAGNPASSSAQSTNIIRWKCPVDGSAQTSIPTTGCNNGETVNFEVHFPQCWDGVNLDSVDHQSHMAYENPTTGCPASHPVVLPQISFNIHYAVSATSRPENWRLASDLYTMSSPGGYSGHGDAVFGWDTTVGNRIRDDCLRASFDCHAHTLGDSDPSEVLY